MATTISLKLARTLVQSLDDLFMSKNGLAERTFTSKVYPSVDEATEALNKHMESVNSLNKEITELKFALRAKVGEANARFGINDLTLKLAKTEQLQAKNFTSKAQHMVKVLSATAPVGHQMELLSVEVPNTTKQKLEISAIKDAINAKNATCKIELTSDEVKSISELLDVQL